MNDESLSTNKMLHDIQNTLKDFIDNNITLEKARTQYAQFMHDYKKLTLKNPPPDANFIKGLLLNHNTENFCKLSFIYKKIDEKISMDAYSGDLDLIHGHEDTVLDVVDGEYRAVPLGSGSISELELRLVRRKIKNGFFITGAVSSSKLFEEERLMMLADMLERIYDKILIMSRPYLINYYNTRTRAATEFIKDRSLNNIALTAHVYIFKNIYSIYGHSGRKSLEKISNFITGVLHQNYAAESKLFMLYGSIYIIFLKSEDKMASKIPHIDFSYNNFPIICQKIKIELTHDRPVYKFWEELFAFKKYVDTGDRYA